MEPSCDTLFMCFITTLKEGIRAGGGISDVLRKPASHVSAWESSSLVRKLHPPWGNGLRTLKQFVGLCRPEQWRTSIKCHQRLSLTERVACTCLHVAQNPIQRTFSQTDSAQIESSVLVQCKNLMPLPIPYRCACTCTCKYIYMHITCACIYVLPVYCISIIIIWLNLST